MASVSGGSGDSQLDETKAITKVRSIGPFAITPPTDVRKGRPSHRSHSLKYDGSVFNHEREFITSDPVSSSACHLKTENYNRALYYAEKVNIRHFIPTEITSIAAHR